MEAGLETVEILTDVIARQAAVIAKLYSVVGQLNATVDFAPEIEEIQRRATEITESPES